MKVQTKYPLLDWLWLVLAIVPMVTIYANFSSLFHDADFFLQLNTLSGMACVLISGISMIKIFQKTKKIHLLALSVILSSTIYLGVYFYFAIPSVRADWVKSSYLQDNDYYTQWNIKRDFFDSNYGEFLLQDSVFIHKMMAKMTFQEYRWMSVGLGLYHQDYADYAISLYGALRSMGKSDSEIIQLPNGNFLILALLFNEQTTYKAWEEVSPKIKNLLIAHPIDSLFQSGITSPKTLEQYVQFFKKNLASRELYETEMFLYLLTYFPYDLSEVDFQTVIEHWIKFKPRYRDSIIKVAQKRNELRRIFQKIARSDGTIGIELAYKGIPAEFSLLRPFIISTGYVPVQGKDFKIYASSEMEKLRTETRKVYKDVPRTRTKTTRVGSTYRNSTETYYEKQYVGTESSSVWQYKCNFLFGNSGADTLSVWSFLPHQFYDKAQKRYRLDSQEMARGECWLYALPEKLYCPTCNSN